MTRRVEFQEKEGRASVNDALQDSCEVGGEEDFVTSRDLMDILTPFWDGAVAVVADEPPMMFTGQRLARAIRTVFQTTHGRSMSQVIKVEGVPTKVYKRLKLK